MLRSQSFVKKTRKGNVVKVVKEHYLRDDLTCGLQNCTTCNNSEYSLLQDAKQFLIVDTNVVIHQIDLLEHTGFQNVIILGTVLEEVNHINMKIYARLRDIIANKQKHFYVFANEYHK